MGGIVLGIGGDNAAGAAGSFFEGAITAGVAQDSIDDKIQANIVDAGYGRTTTAIWHSPNGAKAPSMFNVHYNPSTANAVISYTLQDSRRVSMVVFNQQGRQIARIASGVIPAGRHEAVWSMKRIPAGVYFYRISFDGYDGGTGKIVVGKKLPKSRFRENRGRETDDSAIALTPLSMFQIPVFRKRGFYEMSCCSYSLPGSSIGHCKTREGTSEILYIAWSVDVLYGSFGIRDGYFCFARRR